jgi:hypothetical protein
MGTKAMIQIGGATASETSRRQGLLKRPPDEERAYFGAQANVNSEWSSSSSCPSLMVQRWFVLRAR